MSVLFTILRALGVFACLPGLFVAAAHGPPPRDAGDWLFVAAISIVIWIGVWAA